MSADPLEDLLEKLTSGDTAAAEQVFRSYEPYLRMVVRRQLPGKLRAKLDSADIVQSAWVDVLDGFRKCGWRFADVAHLRAFLVKVTRNRFLERLRQHRRALDREHPPGEGGLEAVLPSGDPRPSEVAQANELWQQMLLLCPPAHRPLLLLKRQGLSLAEIADRTGLHEGSVRRILYDLEKRLEACQRATAPDPEPLQ
jgi:RNA polymerase sigma-70 factor (ECF subfamily)